MFTIIYEPADYGWVQPSREIRCLSFWLGAQADDGRKGPFSIRTGTPKTPKATDPMAAPFNIVVGGVYRCRDGWLAYINRRTVGPLPQGVVAFIGVRINPVMGASPGSDSFQAMRWLENGRRYTFPLDEFHPTNICAPYVQPPEF